MTERPSGDRAPWSEITSGVLDVVAGAVLPSGPQPRPDPSSPGQDHDATGGTDLRRQQLGLVRALLQWLDPSPDSSIHIAGDVGVDIVSAIAADWPSVAIDPVRNGMHDVVISLGGDLSMAAAGVSAEGIMLAVLENPAGLSARLSARVGSDAPIPTAAETHADAVRQTNEVGLPAQRWLLPYIGESSVTLAPGANSGPSPSPGLLATFIGDPLPTEPRVPALSDPLEATLRSWSDGLALDLADLVVLVAARDHDSVTRSWPSGHLWNLQAPDADASWRPLISVTDGPSGWELEPAVMIEADPAMPYFPVARPALVAPGVRGDRLIGELLAVHGPRDERLRATIATWWRAAESVMAAVAPPRPFDVRPVDFVVDSDGRWSHLGSQIASRPEHPAAVMALRGLIQVVRATARRRWLAGTDRGSTVFDIARILADAIDLVVGVDTLYHWAAIEAAVAVRSGTDATGTADVRDRMVASMQTEIVDSITDLPLTEQVRAAIDIEARSRETALGMRHETLRVEIAEQRREVERLRSRTRAEANAA